MYMKLHITFQWSNMALKALTHRAGVRLLCGRANFAKEVMEIPQLISTLDSTRVTRERCGAITICKPEGESVSEYTKFL